MWRGHMRRMGRPVIWWNIWIIVGGVLLKVRNLDYKSRKT